MANLIQAPKAQFFDANGDPLSGGKLYTYAAGTTTPLATYTDSGGGTANANPVILNSRGEANVWCGSSLYKFVLKDANDVLIWTVDNLNGPLAALGIGAYTAGQGIFQVAQTTITGGAPQTSGTTDSNQFAAIGNGTYSMRLGLYSSGAMWIQNSNIGNYATNYGVALQPNGGNVGIAIEPVSNKGTLQTYRPVTGAGPASSGSTDDNQIAFFGNANAILRVGMYSTNQFWLQSSAAGNYATNYDLIINPNGRDVFVGGTSITTAVGYVGASSTAKCYVIFDGTGAGPITPISGVNSTSITKNSTGNYTINYSTNISAADNTISYSFGTTGYFLTVVSQTASSVRISIKDAGGTETDLARIMITVFGI